MSDAEDFNWSEENTIVSAVQAIAVYFNPRGDIVIRQQDAMGDEDDFIVIPIQHARRVAEAINDLCRDANGAANDGG
jgi:hypothetical protein